MRSKALDKSHEHYSSVYVEREDSNQASRLLLLSWLGITNLQRVCSSLDAPTPCVRGPFGSEISNAESQVSTLHRSFTITK